MNRAGLLSFRSAAAIGVVTALPVLVAARGATLLMTRDTARAPEPVSRETLVSALPPSAFGQALELVRYVIEPGTTLPPHTHPGMQIGWIESGILHYVVVDGGETPVHLGARDGRPATVETLRPGQELDLHPGDALVEAEGVVHYGANRGEQAVVIWCATLLRHGQPPATIAGARPGGRARPAGF